MKYILSYLAIIGMFAFCVFIMVQQRNEIRHWKHEAELTVQLHNAKNHDLNKCVADNKFLRNGVENLISVMENKQVVKAIGRSELPPLVMETR